MFDWISQNKDVLNVLIGFATLMVWVVYAQLLYNGYKRQRRPRVVINRGRHKGVDALCLISNMSAESIFIQHIVARLETDQGTYFQDVTELEQNYQEGDEERERHSSGDTPSLSDSTRQGPLGAGEFVHIGAFNSVIERIAQREGLRLDQHRDDRAESEKGIVRLRSLTIQLVAILRLRRLPHRRGTALPDPRPGRRPPAGARHLGQQTPDQPPAPQAGAAADSGPGPRGSAQLTPGVLGHRIDAVSS